MLRIAGAGRHVVDLDGILGTAIRDLLGVLLFYRFTILPNREVNSAVVSGGLF